MEECRGRDNNGGGENKKCLRGGNVEMVMVRLYRRESTSLIRVRSWGRHEEVKEGAPQGSFNRQISGERVKKCEHSIQLEEILKYLTFGCLKFSAGKGRFSEGRCIALMERS